MNPIHFPEETNVLAKGQPEYRPLPVCIKQFDTDVPLREFTCKYELTEIELAQIALTKCIYFTQTGMVFQPICPQLENRFALIPISYKQNEEDKSFEVFVPLLDGSEQRIWASHADLAINLILESHPNLAAENLQFYERPTKAVAPGGDIEDIL